MISRMEAVVFCGIQASGKSTYYQSQFADTHVRLNLDMLKTRNREDILLHACLAAQQAFVADNTNLTRLSRARYLQLAKAVGFRSSLYYFQTSIDEAIQRNAARVSAVPELAIRGALAKLQIPSKDEGFESVHYVKLDGMGGFCCEEWRDELR